MSKESVCMEKHPVKIDTQIQLRWRRSIEQVGILLGPGVAGM